MRELREYACLLTLMGCAAANPLAEVPLEAPFTRITEGEIATQNFSSEGAAWGDYDNDGWLDIVVGHNPIPGGGSVFHNDRDGTFTRHTIGGIEPDKGDGFHALAWGDYDNDGFLDLTGAQFFSGRSPFFHNDGQGNLTQLAPSVSGELVAPGGLQQSRGGTMMPTVYSICLWEAAGSKVSSKITSITIMETNSAMSLMRSRHRVFRRCREPGQTTTMMEISTCW